MTTKITGTIAAPNERGLRLEDEEGWRNISRYAQPKPDPTAFPAGTHVQITLDKQGYIRQVTPISGNDQEERSSDKSPSRSNGTPTSASDIPPKDVVITRLSCLKTAATVVAASLTARSELETEEGKAVMILAQRFERWTNRLLS